MRHYLSIFFLVSFFALQSAECVAAENSFDLTYEAEPKEYDARPDVEAVASEIKTNPTPAKMRWYLNAVLEAMLRRADYFLRIRGEDAAADEIWAEWKIHKKHLFAIGREDLGDHKPLSEWLSRLYVRLEAKLGKWAMVQLGLDQIKIVNYAVPVVFYPKMPGIDRKEYRLHFAPLAKVIAFWMILSACEVAFSVPILGEVCDPAAAFGAHLMEVKFAPWLSDLIWNASHRRR